MLWSVPGGDPGVQPPVEVKQLVGLRDLEIDLFLPYFSVGEEEVGKELLELVVEALGEEQGQV